MHSYFSCPNDNNKKKRMEASTRGDKRFQFCCLLVILSFAIKIMAMALFSFHSEKESEKKREGWGLVGIYQFGFCH